MIKKESYNSSSHIRQKRIWIYVKQYNNFAVTKKDVSVEKNNKSRRSVHLNLYAPNSIASTFIKW